MLTVPAAFVLLSSLTGCADTPEVIVHDLLVFWNELADFQLHATNEQTAKELLDFRYKPIKARYDGIKDRKEKKYMGIEKDKDLQKEVKYAIVDYYEETVATAKRLYHVRERLDRIMKKILDDDMAQRNLDKPDMSKVANLKKVRDWPKEFLWSIPGGGGGGPGATKGPDNPIISGQGKWGEGLVPYPPPPKKPK